MTMGGIDFTEADRVVAAIEAVVALTAAVAVFLAAVAAGHFNCPWAMRRIVRPLQSLHRRRVDRR